MNAAKLLLLGLVTFPALAVAAVLGAVFGMAVVGYALIVAAAHWSQP